MGLAINAYRQLRLVDAKYDEETGDFISPTGEILRGVIGLYPNSDFPNHTHLTETSRIHKDNGEPNSIRVGSYSYYYYWRVAIATLFGNNVGDRSWLNIENAPFNELLNFSDCEGVITGGYLNKIQQDFNVYFELAEEKLPTHYFETYCEIKEMFDFAAPNGVIIFC